VVRKGGDEKIFSGHFIRKGGDEKSFSYHFVAAKAQRTVGAS
jgi:hypothetical protein